MVVDFLLLLFCLLEYLNIFVSEFQAKISRGLYYYKNKMVWLGGNGAHL